MTRHRNVANPELAEAMRGLRRSSAAQPHQDRRTRRGRTRSDARARSLREFA